MAGHRTMTVWVSEGLIKELDLVAEALFSKRPTLAVELIKIGLYKIKEDRPEIQKWIAHNEFKKTFSKEEK